jgi:hypothetical protein
MCDGEFGKLQIPSSDRVGQVHALAVETVEKLPAHVGEAAFLFNRDLPIDVIGQCGKSAISHMLNRVPKMYIWQI